MITIATSLEKGGSAKTTTAQAIGAGLANRGEKVLFVDLDAQSNLTQSLLNGKPPEVAAIDVLTEEADITDAIVEVSDNIDLLPASRKASKIDKLIGDELGREKRLVEALEDVEDDYDYCIIDTPPALGLLTINALTAADWVVIPAQTDIYALDGIYSLVKTINTVREYSNPNLRVAGILLTRYNGRTNLSKLAGQRAADIAEEVGTKVFETKIREGIAVREAQAVGEDIFSYAPRSNPAKDYSNFIDELMETVK